MNKTQQISYFNELRANVFLRFSGLVKNGIIVLSRSTKQCYGVIIQGLPTEPAIVWP